jgi:hypothetical protein
MKIFAQTCFLKQILLIAMAGVSLVFFACTDPQRASGGGTETIVGTVLNSNGSAAVNTLVELFPADYNPVTSSLPDDIMTVMTDKFGKYEFSGLQPGIYTVLAVAPANGFRTSHYNFNILETNDVVLYDTLQKTGVIKITVWPDADTVNGYVYIPGTSIVSFLKSSPKNIVMDSVPAGIVLQVMYAQRTTQTRRVLRYNVLVPAGDTAKIVNPEWKYSRRLSFNTTSSGANVSGNVNNFPLLVRLDRSIFTFSQAEAHGNDIRFLKADSVLLPYEVERWDSSRGVAEIWVKIDTVFGNASTQYITMCWGNPLASVSGNSATVFDTALGFQGAWHFSENGNDAAHDATANHFDGIPFGMNASSGVDGIIGGAQSFDGSSSYFVMPNTAAGKLNFPAHGTYSVSAWAMTNALDTNYHLIVSKGDCQYNLEIMNTTEWEFSEFEQTGWEFTTTPSPAVIGQWVYLTGIRNGAKQYLFVNGTCVDSSISIMLSPLTRNDSLNLMVGKKVNDSLFFFNGIIDEVRISSIALSADWIKLCYMNQKIPDALVVLKN